MRMMRRDAPHFLGVYDFLGFGHEPDCWPLHIIVTYLQHDEYCDASFFHAFHETN